jgi:hypothetical protein
MGRLLEIATQRAWLLEAEHLVGRARICALKIDQRYVSAQHAVVRWTGERWELKDLGSRNGTYLDGVRLTPGRDYHLRTSSRIQIGRAEQEWELVDDSPAGVMAVPLDGSEPRLMEGDLLPLPSADDPRVTIFRNPDGSCVLERPNESIVPVTNLQVLEIAGHLFRFSGPDSLGKTSMGDSGGELDVRHLRLQFLVSRDEERVALRATWGDRSFDLGTRSCHGLLLTLARRRIADATEGIPEMSCGWLDLEDVARPSLAPPQLNVSIFRIRKQFSSIGVTDPAGIIERRPRTRQLRIGVGQISIVVL